MFNIAKRVLWLSRYAMVAWAQAPAAELAGMVMGPSGAVVSGAKITNTAHIEPSTEASSAGIYYAPALRPGAYSVRFTPAEGGGNEFHGRLAADACNFLSCLPTSAIRSDSPWAVPSGFPGSSTAATSCSSGPATGAGGSASARSIPPTYPGPSISPATSPGRASCLGAG